MFRISKDSSAYYLTSVARDRLPVFRLEDEPLVLDLVQIAWRRGTASVR